ncbi:hypothetical protein HK101_005652 [Irineochytrium annulatum]|nr:hypothetical protein HK101_005652 [Irineochytrium annulatum]
MRKRGNNTVKKETDEATEKEDKSPFVGQPTIRHALLRSSSGVDYEPEVLCGATEGFSKAEDDSLICYRRNYFRVACAYTLLSSSASSGLSPITSHPSLSLSTTAAAHPPLPSESLFIHLPSSSDPPLPVLTFSVSLSARVQNSSRAIAIVQHTAKRDKGPKGAPEMRVILPGGCPDGATGVSAQQQSYVAVFDRLQFKASTPSGNRASAGQLYVICVELIANCAGDRHVHFASLLSHPIVVRGRSPSHYSNEGPAAGSTTKRITVKAASGVAGTAASGWKAEEADEGDDSGEDDDEIDGGTTLKRSKSGALKDEVPAGPPAHVPSQMTTPIPQHFAHPVTQPLPHQVQTPSQPYLNPVPNVPASNIPYHTGFHLYPGAAHTQHPLVSHHHLANVPPPTEFNALPPFIATESMTLTATHSMASQPGVYRSVFPTSAQQHAAPASTFTYQTNPAAPAFYQPQHHQPVDSAGIGPVAVPHRTPPQPLYINTSSSGQQRQIHPQQQQQQHANIPVSDPLLQSYTDPSVHVSYSNPYQPDQHPVTPYGLPTAFSHLDPHLPTMAPASTDLNATASGLRQDIDADPSHPLRRWSRQRRMSESSDATAYCPSPVAVPSRATTTASLVPGDDPWAGLAGEHASLSHAAAAGSSGRLDAMDAEGGVDDAEEGRYPATPLSPNFATPIQRAASMIAPWLSTSTSGPFVDDPSSGWPAGNGVDSTGARALEAALFGGCPTSFVDSAAGVGTSGGNGVNGPGVGAGAGDAFMGFTLDDLTDPTRMLSAASCGGLPPPGVAMSPENIELAKRMMVEWDDWGAAAAAAPWAPPPLGAGGDAAGTWAPTGDGVVAPMAFDPIEHLLVEFEHGSQKDFGGWGAGMPTAAGLVENNLTVQSDGAGMYGGLLEGRRSQSGATMQRLHAHHRRARSDATMYGGEYSTLAPGLDDAFEGGGCSMMEK